MSVPSFTAAMHSVPPFHWNACVLTHPRLHQHASSQRRCPGTETRLFGARGGDSSAVRSRDGEVTSSLEESTIFRGAKRFKTKNFLVH